MQKSRRFAGGTISIKTGSEGPRHDPYSYTEYTISRTGGFTATLHQGLGVWLEVNGNHTNAQSNEQEKVAVDYFEQLCHISLKTFERAIHRPVKCCAKPKPRWSAGYPGETLCFCQSCGKYLDGSFNEAAVI